MSQLYNNAIKETKRHGLINFPYEVYRCRIPETFPFFPMHYHDEFEVVYILEGTLSVVIQGGHYTCSEGDIVVIPPGKIHGFYQNGTDTCHYTNIVFSLNLLESPDSEIYEKFFSHYFTDSVVVPYYFPKGSEINETLKSSIKVLFDTRHDVLTLPLLIKSELYKILSVMQGISLPKDTHLETAEIAVKRLLPVFKLVKENYGRDISVEEAASLINYSESYFMSIFKKVTGTSFTNFLKMTRLENARVMLLGTDLQVLEIAQKCGFENISYFIRAFKENYKFSPLQYKKMRGKK